MEVLENRTPQNYCQATAKVEKLRLCWGSKKGSACNIFLNLIQNYLLNNHNKFYLKNEKKRACTSWGHHRRLHRGTTSINIAF